MLRHCDIVDSPKSVEISTDLNLKLLLSYIMATKSAKSHTATPKPKRQHTKPRSNLVAWTEYCRKYRTNCKYYIHNKKHDDIQCALCNQRFWTGRSNRYDTLNSHLKRVHKNEEPPSFATPSKSKANKILSALKKNNNMKQRAGLKAVFCAAFFIATMLISMTILSIISSLF